MMPLPNLVAILIVVAICLGLIAIGERVPERWRRAFRYSAAAGILLNELGWHLWNVAQATWTVQTMLPLQLCSLLVYGTAWMLAARSYPLFEVVYFLGIGGASWALVTPDANVFGFPHYTFFQTYLSHGLIVIAAVYMAAVEGFRPTVNSLFKTVVAVNLYLPIAGLADFLLGANYMFLAHKPYVPSLLDDLGPWPWYILSGEAVGLALVGLLYLPFLERHSPSPPNPLSREITPPLTPPHNGEGKGVG